jgi:hypothetical protein
LSLHWHQETKHFESKHEGNQPFLAPKFEGTEANELSITFIRLLANEETAGAILALQSTFQP